jgi:hypothetical protein
VFASTRVGFQMQSLTNADLIRMQQIMEQYQDAAFDFTDTAIMALSERLNVTRVCTFDRRDFSIFRPAHCDAALSIDLLSFDIFQYLPHPRPVQPNLAPNLSIAPPLFPQRQDRFL